MLKSNLSTAQFAFIMSFVNFLIFHYPFFSFVLNNLDYASFNGIIIILSLVLLMLVLNFLVFYFLLFLSRYTGKLLLLLFFIINAAAVYFINTYSIIIDESMVGNITNTNPVESSSFFSIKLVLYIIVMGIIPGILIFKIKIINEPFKKFITLCTSALILVLILVFVNSGNWLWIDKNSKKLGGLAMPWSYSVNTSLFYIHQYKKNQKEILLPDAVIKDNKKSIVVLVIGESARSENFSLYGYKKKTNPLLSKTENLYHFKAVSSATYTTAGVKAILDYKKTDELYEILPNYLFRNNIEVIWRTTNWGEPPLHIKNYQNREFLSRSCEGADCSYDGILLTRFKDQVLASKKDKILFVLHTSTSHGPTYSKKYPAQFQNFSPVCSSVELGNCSKTELLNAYDNTIVYTDYILKTVIDNLKELKDYNSTMIFVSDHGESLGEKNLYMHGLPISIAPKEQYEIPFIVWVSENSKKIKPNKTLSQNHVFHSVLNFLNIESPIYNEKLNIFE
ncbi:phosphoethanolamine--lipid A transferase EptA [Flavobacterium aquidurense]|uniref:phosphoethanolamine--lipid A transferase EptA n=1 Tax=Flavobacterium TaxID=237 RepID=UPI0006FBDB85|nr:phosphoethanolamine--lipid A transferase EptA [Flavobacterium sp. Leaf82]KQO24891.1 sulfatase [Flavobacterium sp. Leaf82]